MEAIEAIMQRRSVRSYRAEPLPKEDLMTILECGRCAPSAANRQPCRIIVVTENDLKQELARACSNQMWMADAGAIVAMAAQPQVSPNWYAVDAAIALQTMVIAARALGYGTCWIGAFDEGQVKRVLRLEESDRVVALSPIGVPTEWPEARPRKRPAEVFVFNPR